MEAVDAIVLAAGRLSREDAERAGSEIKALIQVGTTTPLRVVIEAMRESKNVARVIVVGPKVARSAAGEVDLWLDERQSGEDNLFAGLRAVRTRLALVSASDTPFIQAAHIDAFLSRVPPDTDFAYPVFTQAEFLAVFPGGRHRFARVGNESWTGGSMCLMNAALALRNAGVIRRAFIGRRNQFALASVFGIEILARYVAGKLTVADIERRLDRLTGGKAVAIRGTDAALAMDLDSIGDVEYVRSRSDAQPPALKEAR